MLKDYQGTLKDLNKTHVLERNDACTLSMHGDIKGMLKNYQGVLEDLDKVHVFEPNNTCTLNTHGHVK
jgi:hypothetical protein